MKASLILLLTFFTVSSFAYTFAFKRLGNSDQERFQKRAEQSLAIIKIMNAEDDAVEISKGTSLIYESQGGEINFNGITQITITRQARDSEGQGLYYCEYQFDAQPTGVLRVTLISCKPGLRPIYRYQK